MAYHHPKGVYNHDMVVHKQESIMKHVYKTKGVCAMSISFDLEGNVVSNVSFLGGCNGNLKAISKLVDGMSVEEIESKLKGNKCGFKSTSCADQLAIAVREKYEQSK